MISEIELAPEIPDEAFFHIEDFSHLEILFYFNVADGAPYSYSRHPRGNKAYPLTGILAQRNKDRPNHIGLTTVQLIAHNGRTISVKGLDAIDGTPILDIKPVFKEYAPKGNIKQPAWVSDLMKDYWK
ncbi:MAG TPA: SAM-dependent methyltransferase [Flavisolibacter sp.]|nr:SAM-dependent methyltransferase [Flavisolibacter sp.]